MTANRWQALDAAHVAAHSTARRRSVPPSRPEPVSLSLNQRWRERPRCPALRVTPGRRDGVVHAIVGRAACRCPRAHVVRDTRIARVHVFVSRFAGTMLPTTRTDIGPRASHGCPGRTSRSWTQILRSHHRAFHSGAVLGVVNALRSASTRPSAGPAGIDDASARLFVPGTHAMVLSVSITQGVDAQDAQAYVGIIASVPHGHSPPFAATANGARIRSAPTGHGIERRPQHIAGRGPTIVTVVGTPVSCQNRDLSRRIILRITRRAGERSPAARVALV
jgi:hypothetical protein